MRILLDTNCLLWFVSDPKQLTDKAVQSILSNENDIYVSAASAWEISIKVSLRKLKIPGTASSFVTSVCKRNGFLQLPISVLHAEAVRLLPPIHGDPFDRMLIAQANEESLKFLTADKTLKSYDCDFIWAKTS